MPKSDRDAIRKAESSQVIQLTTQTVQVDIFENVNEADVGIGKGELTSREKSFVVWTVLQILCLVYNIVFTPVQICYFKYKLGDDDLMFMHVCDYVVDFICGVDIYFRSCYRGDKENKTRQLLQYTIILVLSLIFLQRFPSSLALTFSGGRTFFSLLRLNRLLRLFDLNGMTLVF